MSADGARASPFASLIDGTAQTPHTLRPFRMEYAALRRCSFERSGAQDGGGQICGNRIAKSRFRSERRPLVTENTRTTFPARTSITNLRGRNLYILRPRPVNVRFPSTQPRRRLSSSAHQAAFRNVNGNETRPRKPRLVRQVSGPGFSARSEKRRTRLSNATWPSIRASAAPKQKCAAQPNAR